MSQGTQGIVSLVIKNVRFHYRLWLDRQFDRRFGTDTSGRIELENLSTVGSNRNRGVYYESTPTKLFTFFLSNVLVDLSNFTYIDLGSGKGRTLLLASEYPFLEVLGIEFSRELHDCAVRNIEKYGSNTKKCQIVRSLNIDACEFRFPRGDLLVYAYNPFDEVVMSAVLENLVAAMSREERRVILVYYNPRWSVLDRFPMLRLTAKLAVPWDPTREIQRPAAIFSNIELPRAQGWL
jgi:SAM-dependent methyltransferase